MKKIISKSLFFQNAKLINKVLKLNIQIIKLEEEIEDKSKEIKKLKDIVFETSSNNEFLINQRKRYITKNKELRTKINELENKRLPEDLEKFIKKYLRNNKNESIQFDYKDTYEIYKAIYGGK